MASSLISQSNLYATAAQFLSAFTLPRGGSAFVIRPRAGLLDFHLEGTIDFPNLERFRQVHTATLTDEQTASLMKTHLSLFALLLIGGAFSRLLATDQEKPADTAKPTRLPGETSFRADFEKTTAAFHEALRTNDPETLFKYVADDVVMMPPNEALVRGKAAMASWYGTFLSAFRTTTLKLSAPEVTMSDNWATELGQYEWGLQPAAGGEPVVDKGNYIQIWNRQRNGRWLFFREIWNSSIPASPATSK